MPQKPKTWVDEIVEALIELGGHGFLNDIYDRIEDRIIEGKCLKTLTPRWHETVRRIIELNSMDSLSYNGKHNIFYAVDGIGKGHWGLVSFEPNSINVDLTEDDAGFIEGKKYLRQHVCRERNAKLIKEAKQRFKNEHEGKLFCEVCGFNFLEYYGIEYIEAHHLVPISEIPEGYKTKLDDIAIVCANCHRILHRRRPWLKKQNIKELLNI